MDPMRMRQGSLPVKLRVLLVRGASFPRAKARPRVVVHIHASGPIELVVRAIGDVDWID